MLLRERHVQPAPRQEEEFQHLDVGRQPPRAQRRDIGQIRIAAEQPLDHRGAKARFQKTPRLRLLQRQRREQGQADGRISRRPRIQRIDDVVGLAKPERQTHHEVLADITDDLVDDGLGGGKQLWHRGRHPGQR